ncbi:MAG TPA: type II secretion system F family protein [Tepidisphaeraceae bacterium]|jgi:type II secretory pathway component PulF|nr:type II secretion system F family protein [Tepidisphaeraceae bacterium]
MQSQDAVSTGEPTATGPVVSFAYRAQSNAGDAINGSIDARDADDAQARLSRLGLRVLELNSATPVKPKPLRGDDFVAFNQQLGQLASAGLPLEQGLRLIAQDMRSGRLSRTVNLVAEELERGVPIGEAFQRHQTQFPPLYGRLMDAGVRSGNLPAMLLNLSRYSELVQRLRGLLWRSAAYPLMVLIGLALVLLFLSQFVLPQFESIFESFRVQLPAVTQLLLWFGRVLPMLLIVVVILCVGAFVLLPMLRHRGDGFGQSAMLSLPLVGPVLRRSLLARWCDAVKLAVDAGLDLPAAVGLASDAVRSPALRHDGDALLDWLQSSPVAHQPPPGLRLLPASVTATVALAVREQQLSNGLGTLAQMYAQQAEQRMAVIPAVLGPVLLIVVTIIIGFILLGILAPMISLLKSITGGGL